MRIHNIDDRRTQNHLATSEGRQAFVADVLPRIGGNRKFRELSGRVKERENSDFSAGWGVLLTAAFILSNLTGVASALLFWDSSDSSFLAGTGVAMALLVVVVLPLHLIARTRYDKVRPQKIEEMCRQSGVSYLEFRILSEIRENFDSDYYAVLADIKQAESLSRLKDLEAGLG